MNRLLSTGLAGLFLTLAAAAPAAGATVTVRAEGSTSTLVPEVRVTPSADVVVDKRSSGGTTCAGTTAAGALELATGGDWGGKAYDFGGGPSQAVEIIRGESHVFGSGAYWSFMVNNSPAPVGVCDYTPVEGDEILFYAACEGAPQPTCFSGDPLDVRAPATAAPGAAFTVRVDEYTSPFGEPATKAPSAGATVSGGGATATTGADGTASIAVAERGPVTLTATKGGRVRDEVAVCITDGADGFCGTAAPSPSPSPPACVTTGDDGRCGTADRRAPRATITSVPAPYRFSRSDAPRELAATVTPDPSGLATVKLALTRQWNGRCWALSGKRDAFRRARCGRHPRFAVGDRPEVSYLLPARLKRGRYVLDVIAVDRANNRDTLQRGRNRVVFYVR